MKLSVEEYLKLDRAAEVKSEYHDGEMFPIEAISLVHGYISLNLGGWLKQSLKPGACRGIGVSIRVRVSPSKYVVPDFVVFCGEPELTDEQQDTLTNPKTILEILSPSTANYDFGEKFKLYRRLPTFDEYVLISQDSARVETYFKTPENQWILSTYAGLDAIVPLRSLDTSIPMAEIYDDIELPAQVED